MPLYRHTKLPPAPELGEKTFWDYLPRQSTRRVLFLLIALGAVLFIKHAGGWSFGGLLDPQQPAPRGAEPGAPVYHIKVTRPDEPSPPARPDDPKSKSP
jgi:hypothetical protein